MGQSLRVEGDYYISQLRITVSHSLVEKTIECIYDNGTATETVGRYSTSTIITDRNGEYLNIHTHVMLFMHSFIYSTSTTTTTNRH